jgi:hypothetical protein
MDLFQCGGARSDQSYSHFSAPLAISCGTSTAKVALEDVSQCRSVKESALIQMQSGTSNTVVRSNINNLESDKSRKSDQEKKRQQSKREVSDTMSYKSKDGLSISKFEEDLALVPQDVVYVRHGLDVDDKIRKAMESRKYPYHTPSFSTLSQSTDDAHRHKKLSNASKGQKLSTVKESSVLSSSASSFKHPVRIFCKLERSERFKVICFPRDFNSLDELLRIIETKLMFGVMGDRPGSLLLVVDPRASQPDDFVEIEDITSIRDEDRFVFLPYSKEKSYIQDSSATQDERLDLNYSVTEGSPPPSPQRNRNHSHKPPMRPDEERISDWMMSDKTYSDSNSQLSPTRNRSPHAAESLEWSVDNNDFDSILSQHEVTRKTNYSHRPKDDELRDGPPPSAIEVYDHSYDHHDANNYMYSELTALARRLKKSRLKQELEAMKRRKPKPETLNNAPTRQNDNNHPLTSEEESTSNINKKSVAFSDYQDSTDNHLPSSNPNRRRTIRIIKMSPEKLASSSSREHLQSRPPRSPRDTTTTNFTTTMTRDYSN